jgi:hypothetical protein
MQDDLVAELVQRRAHSSSPQPGIHFYTHLQVVSGLGDQPLRAQRLAGDLHHRFRLQAPVQSMPKE